jgi:two-component system, cell cycle sensor histidine kinase and response regulator CckA
MAGRRLPLRRQGTAADPSARRHRILVVEDEEAVAEGLRLLLEQEYVVDLAASGQRALELLLGGRAFDATSFSASSAPAVPFDAVPFEAVLCDLMMPGMSGIQLYRALKARAPGMEERLVFMTGGAFTLEAEAFLDEVSNARVEKPFDFASIDRLLRQAVARRY